MKILLTGCGYLGSVMTRYLANQSDVESITVIDNLMYKQNSPLSFADLDKVKFVHGDVTNQDFILEQMKDCDIVIPLAAIVGMPACKKNPTLAEEVNLYQIKFICDHLEKNQKIIYPNTNSIYGTGIGNEYCNEDSPIKIISHYAKTKYEAERFVLNAGGVSVRLATAFGVSIRMRLDLLVNNFVYRAKRDGFLVLFESHYKRNFIHVHDIARAFYFLIKQMQNGLKGEAYNLGLSDANISKLELANRIKNYIPNLVIYENDFSTDPDQRNYIVSNEKIEKLGFKPEKTLDFGIQQLLEYYQVFKIIEDQHFTNL